MDLEVADFYGVSCKVNIVFELNVVYKVKGGKQIYFRCLSHRKLLSTQTSIILSKKSQLCKQKMQKNIKNIYIISKPLTKKAFL